MGYTIIFTILFLGVVKSSKKVIKLQVKGCFSSILATPLFEVKCLFSFGGFREFLGVVDINVRFLKAIFKGDFWEIPLFY